MLEKFDGLVVRLFGGLIARQFVVFGGVPAVLKKGATLLSKGIIPTYNRIDEHVRDRRRIREVCDSYVALVLGMDHTNRGSIAIKPSAFGMELGPLMFAQTLRRFIGAIAGRTVEIEIDAEHRETLCAVQQVLNSFAPKLPKGITFRPAFQMHLPEALREELVGRHRILDMPLRIVKGSGLYDIGEPELSDEEVIVRYYETFRDQVSKGRHPNLATVRDRTLLESIASMIESENISPMKFTVQFLDGPFGGTLRRQYLSKGYRVGCYVTFVDPSEPDAWKGYVKRRIAFGRKLLFGK